MSEWISGASFAALLAACTALCLLFAAATTATGVAVERSLSGRLRIWDLPLAPGQLRHEALASLRFLALCPLAFAGVLHAGWLNHAETGPGGGLLTFAVCWVGFDVLDYAMHRALHTRPLYRFHRHYHASRVTTAFSGFSLGRVESPES